MRIIPLMAVMAMFLAAGCVGQPGPGPTTTGNGLEITSFTSDVTEAFSTRTARLFADFENQGESTVYKSRSLVWLNGPIGTGLLQWRLTGNQDYNFKRDLSPADTQRGVPAGTDTTSWTLTAPDLDPGQRKTDTFTARAYYDYETKAVGEVIAYSEAEATAIRNRGEQLQSSSFSTTSGPVALSVRVIPDPVTVVLDSNGNSSEIMTLELTISNVGDGTVYRYGAIDMNSNSPSLAFSDLNIVNVTINPGNLKESGTDCVPTTNPELIGGKPTSVTCDFSIYTTQPIQHFPMLISLNYGYYTEKTLEITAVGR